MPAARQGRAGRRKVYVDDETVAGNAAGKADGKELLLQRTREEEHLTRAHVLLVVHRWHPAEQRLGPAAEVAALRSDLVEDFRRRLGDAEGVPVEHVRCAKARPYQLKNAGEIDALDWFGAALTESSAIGSPPWNCAHGDIVVVKDNREKAPKPSAVGSGAGSRAATGAGGPGRAANSGSRRERAVVFRTRAEVESLQAERRAQAAARELERASAEGRRSGGMSEEERLAKARRDAETEQARQDALERTKAALLHQQQPPRL